MFGEEDDLSDEKDALQVCFHGFLCVCLGFFFCLLVFVLYIIVDLLVLTS
jgi:hypothetical protein